MGVNKALLTSLLPLVNRLPLTVDRNRVRDFHLVSPYNIYSDANTESFEY